MEWNFQKEIESNYMFPTNPGALVNPSFDAAQPLTACNLNQWNGATSTSFDQFSSYNFITTALEDPGFDSWTLMDMSYNPVPTSSEDLAFDGAKLDTLEKGLCQLNNGSGCEDPDSLCLEEFIQGIPDCRVLGLDQVNENFMNSLSDEDIRAMLLYTVEPSQQVVDLCNKPQPLEDDLPINSSMMSQASMALDSSTLVNPRGSITESSILVADKAKSKIFEATALCKFDSVLSRINERTRICFRDACYRLANDSRLLLDESKNESLEFHFEPSFSTSSRLCKVETEEKETNEIDRAIVNLLFSPPCTEPRETWAT